MISKLHLKNFIAFTDLSIDFSRGINIVIGENGTGKTQLLKAILALNGAEAHGAQADEQLARKLCRLYHPLSGQVGGLRRAGTRGKSVLKGTFASGQVITAKFYGKDTAAKVTATSGDVPAPAIFIPTKEVLSLVRGLTAEQPDLPTIERIFDDGYLDLAKQLAKEGTSDQDAKVQLNPRFSSIVPGLTNLIDGQYLLENGRFVFEAGRYVEKDPATRSKAQHAQMYQDSTEWKFVPSSKQHLSSGMTAEGFRKIGVLQRLLSNGSLNPGSTGPLLWDEPESNLNPKLMKDLVQVLLELARNGQQIILATHDYVLLKWFDLLMDKGKEDQVRFFSLYRDSSTRNVKISTTDDYLHIAPNPIDDAFGYLINQEIENDMGGLGK
ncbi:ATP/GTP-binding protein [Achromobacter sp. MFA1 R4]|uniref:AAA family ATPase n=1 Tax=Achromobacter sp. MFA1 R4 TaxID=1881016 RepID=UPI0009536D27|nr:AAA family ATPase [Achromobacter sp. MFA1 R4]SIT20026.1 AAA domain-containing protein [Achromobacter sp. MFA1 R4]